ncbi:Glycine-rich domain-containing 1-like protein [Cladobotryum mycophilum]|uniref:Glycine-rich domain-containing 1-like protein n=1 Tax=Cladobotryum mycophilum TaxID=491253 RepID=A0ABR0SA52_9HYPO
MSLESFDTKASLHEWSKKNMKALTQKYSLYHVPHPGNDGTVIPSPALFDFDQRFDRARYISTKKTEGCHLPSIAECATHLELLEVFYRIRQQVLASEAIDKSMGIKPIRRTKTGRKGDTKTLKDDTLWERRQPKWPVFLEFAVRYTILGTPPPLDVLMVWHSFMLNPRMYGEVCKDHPIYKLRLPWPLVYKAIDHKTWTFNHDETSAQYFESCMEVPADLFAHFSQWGADMEAPGGEYMLRLDRYKLSGIDYTDTEPEGVSKVYETMFKMVDADLGEQLRDAVVRQAEFVDKMNNHLWIRSPALEGTMRRAIDRYDKFLVLLKSKSKTPVVPTLDVDIVWHTHQCSPAQYSSGMKAMVGRFINHDDTIVKEVLGDGFDLTRKMYRIRFGKEYTVCGCWDCEALLSAVEEVLEKNEGDFDMDNIAREAREKVVYYRSKELSLRSSQLPPLPM